MNLPVENNLTNITEWDDDCLTGDLICDCGCREFIIQHTGRQTLGLFQPNIKAGSGPLFIAARCCSCSRKLLLHYSEPEYNPSDEARADYHDLILRRSLHNRWSVRINYGWPEKSGKDDGHWNVAYTDVNIDIFSPEHPKPIRIFE